MHTVTDAPSINGSENKLARSASTNTMDSISTIRASIQQRQSTHSPNSELSNTLEDIRELQNSLRDSTRRGNFSPTTGFVTCTVENNFIPSIPQIQAYHVIFHTVLNYLIM